MTEWLSLHALSLLTVTLVNYSGFLAVTSYKEDWILKFCYTRLKNIYKGLAHRWLLADTHFLNPLGMQTTPYSHNLITEYIFFSMSQVSSEKLNLWVPSFYRVNLFLIFRKLRLVSSCLLIRIFLGAGLFKNCWFPNFLCARLIVFLVKDKAVGDPRQRSCDSLPGSRMWVQLGLLKWRWWSRTHRPVPEAWETLVRSLGGKSPWRRKWQPTPGSCLEKPVDRGAAGVAVRHDWSSWAQHSLKVTGEPPSLC